MHPRGYTRPLTDTKAAAALSVRDLDYLAPGGAQLLGSVSFDLPAKAVLAIAGPNGAGKSTLLAILSGLLAPTAGAVEIAGVNLAQLSPAARAARIAVVGQSAAPDRRLLLRDYVALGQMPVWAGRSVQEHRADLDRVLQMTRLETLAAHPMAQLSGGEAQRAHIARALAQRPKLLFLDEPTNHLDPDAKGRMLSLVAGLGVTVVMVVHDLVMIPEFATHVALIENARLVGFGPAERVLTPDAVRRTFGVEYLLLPHKDRQVPALDIRKTPTPTLGEEP
ncbi:MAG: ABC transporter ATP-binding protein [Pseudomonadota bacterium]